MWIILFVLTVWCYNLLCKASYTLIFILVCHLGFDLLPTHYDHAIFSETHYSPPFYVHCFLHTLIPNWLASFTNGSCSNVRCHARTPCDRIANCILGSKMVHSWALVRVQPRGMECFPFAFVVLPQFDIVFRYLLVSDKW